MTKSGIWMGLAATLALGAAGASSGATTVDRRVPADARGTVTISNVAGRVQVTGWDRAEVQVTGKLGGGVERLDVLQQGTRVEVKVVLPRMSMSPSDGDADLQVSVPKGSALVVTSVSADVRVDGVLGGQQLRSVSGEIDAQPGQQPTEVKSVSGDVTLRGASRVGRLRISTVSGDLKVERVAGALEIVTVSGDVHARLDGMNSLRVRTTSGDIDLAAGMGQGGQFDFESVSGDVKLAATGPGGYAVAAESFSGSVRACFAARVEKDSNGPPNSRLEATRGDGSGRVQVKTMSGDVQVCDR
jgi:DUF4097 and DUF4098 domain-containing protein YvlB